MVDNFSVVIYVVITCYLAMGVGTILRIGGKISGLEVLEIIICVPIYFTFGLCYWIWLTFTDDENNTFTVVVKMIRIYFVIAPVLCESLVRKCILGGNKNNMCSQDLTQCYKDLFKECIA